MEFTAVKCISKKREKRKLRDNIPQPIISSKTPQQRDADLRAQFKRESLIREQTVHECNTKHNKIINQLKLQVEESAANTLKHRSNVIKLQAALEAQLLVNKQLTDEIDKHQETIKLYKHKNNTLDRNIIKLLQKAQTGIVETTEEKKDDTTAILQQITENNERIYELKNASRSNSQPKLSRWQRMSMGKPSRGNSE